MEKWTSTLESMVNWQGKKVFVTGGNGFLGSWLVERLLQQQAQVTCLVCEEIPGAVYTRQGFVTQVREVHGRLEDASLQEYVRMAQPDVVFHLGAQAIVGVANANPVPTFVSNIQGTWNLLEACRVTPGIQAIVVASSDKAYGDNDLLPYTEAHPTHGTHPYDVSKSCTDLLAETYAHSYGLPIGITRCGNIIGGGDTNENRIVPGTIRSLLVGESPVIRSDGTLVRDYVYVADIVDAYFCVAEGLLRGEGVGEAWNASLGQPMTVLEIVDRIRTLMDRTDLRPTVLGHAPNEIAAQYLDSTKIRSRLQWRPTHTVDQALEKTIAWYRMHPAL